MNASIADRKTRIKEPFCGLSHGVGAVLAVAALIALLILAHGRFWHIVGFAIYGASLIVLYTASTLYHSLHASPRQEARLQQLDHVAIFLLIAGSYTPVCLVPLHGAWGWSLLGIEYFLAAVGIATALSPTRRSWLRVTICVVMGWLALVALGPLRQTLPPAALGWLVGGGLIYSAGTIIYATDRPHLWPGRFSAHDLWHLFVLGGSVCHFIVMLRFVAMA